MVRVVGLGPGAPEAVPAAALAALAAAPRVVAPPLAPELRAALPVTPGAAAASSRASRRTPTVAAPDAEAHRIARAPAGCRRPCPAATRCGPARSAPRSRRLAEVGLRLRRECPWDREQTAETIVPHTIEEAFEVADAVAARRRGPAPTSSATCSSRPCSSPSSWRSEGARRPGRGRARPGGQARSAATPTSTARRPRPTAAGVVDLWERRKREERAEPGDLPRPARRASPRWPTRRRPSGARRRSGFDFPDVERGPRQARRGDRRAARRPGRARAGRRAVRRGRRGAARWAPTPSSPCGPRPSASASGSRAPPGWRPGPGADFESLPLGRAAPLVRGLPRLGVGGVIARTSEWAALERHASAVRDAHLRDLFASDPARGEELVVDVADLHLDYSKNRVTRETLVLLAALARRAGRRPAHRGDVRRRADQRHRGAAGAARGAAGPAGRRDRGGRPQRGAGRARRARPHVRPRRAGALGRLDRRHGRAHPRPW